MEITFDKTDSNWNDSITPKRIFEQQFNIGHFLLNNSHPLINELLPKMFGKYKVKMKFTDDGYNNQNIYVSKRLAWRNKKGGKVVFGKGVTLIEGTPTEFGGSNAYPRPSFKEGYCVLEFTCDGFPCTDYLSGWKTEVLHLELLSK